MQGDNCSSLISIGAIILRVNQASQLSKIIDIISLREAIHVNKYGIISLVINQLMLRQIDQQEPISQTNSPTFPQTPSTSKTQLTQIISKLARHQQKSMNIISDRCSNLQYVIASIQVLVGRVSERAQKVAEQKQAILFGELKMKQYEFIVSELKASLAKQAKKEERLIEELQGQRKKLQKYQQDVFKLQAKNSSLTEKIARLDFLLKEKSEEIDRLTQQIHKLKVQTEGDYRGRLISSTIGQKTDTIESSAYNDLQRNLQQLQKEFEMKVAALEERNTSLDKEIKKMQEQYEEERTMHQLARQQLEQLNSSRYELEIKWKREAQLNSELEESYNKLLQSGKTLEITLHKQIQDHKAKETMLRNELKKEKKSFKQCLNNIAQFINNNAKYYLISSSTTDQLEQIRRLFEKTIKKKTDQLSRQLQFQQSENKKLKVRQQQLQRDLTIQEKKDKQTSLKLVRNLSQRDSAKLESGDKYDKRSEANSSFINRSNDKSQDQRYKTVKEKYQSKLELIRKDLKVKQTRINELQKLQQVQFEKSKEKILELELSVSQKLNQIRRFELTLKEKEYELSEHLATIRQLQSKVAYLNDRIQNQKQNGQRLLGMKVQNHEEKLKTLKNNYKELQKREQEKTIKYNKLKTKYEKYEVEATESLKRKNAQLDQLLKDNNRLKTENKLLEEKININQIISAQQNPIKVPPSPNSHLIEQVQLELDQLRSQLADKQKQLSQVIEVNTKMSVEMFGIKKQLRELKNSYEQLLRQHKHLQEEHKYSKETIEQLTAKNEQQAKENHIYFKKELQKSIATIKKLEKASEKQSQQREKLKKEMDEMQAEISTLKTTQQRLKQKNINLSNEVLDEKEEKKRIIRDYEIKLSEYQTKESQLVQIINYKNREGESIRQSMKGEQLIIEAQAKIKIQRQTSTKDLVAVASISINTEAFKQPENRPIVPSQIILLDDQECLEEPFVDKSAQKQIENRSQRQTVTKQVNYFTDLAEDDEQLEDNFDICEEGEEINIGQASLNLQIKEVFNSLRKEIEKIFNEEDISIGVVKMLPKSLEDDFNEFMSYIKEKIYEIKNENNLSFIMAEVGNEPQEVEEHIAEFLSKESLQHLRLRKIIEEKDYMITSLMNQKTQQQNTINQLTLEKEQMDEENENRFMNQCNVYKREIRQSKRIMDILEMNCQSLKNIFKNTLELWTDDNDNEDDIKDNLVLFSNICKLSETDKKRLYLCLDKYRRARKLS